MSDPILSTHTHQPGIHRPRKRNCGSLSTSSFVLIGFLSAFTSRIFDTLGAPSPVNFVHFATVPLAFAIALTNADLPSRKLKNAIYIILLLLFFFLGIIFTSSIVNNAGVPNALLAFLLWVEPFLLLIAIICLPTSQKVLRKLRNWVTYAFFLHTLLALVQHYALNLYTRPGAQDNIQGIFYRSGAGHVVGASVALTFGIYYFLTAQKSPLWLRTLFLVATFWQMILADAKQVLLSLLLGAVLLLFTKLRNAKALLQYLIVGIVVCALFYWCIENLEAFRAFKTWIRPEIYGPDGEATRLKLAAFRIVPTYYSNTFHWLIGLGPGHSIDRLGGWMLREYWSLLQPVGATVHPASGAIWTAISTSWLGDQSSMFSPLFGWAALWGDFGAIGLITYIAIGSVVYYQFCEDDFSKFLIFNVIIVGLIFSQMQEPGYMLSISMLLGLSWHERRARIDQRPAKSVLKKRFLQEDASP